MKTKLKKLLSIALPVFGIVTSAAIAAPLVVSCSSSSPEQKHQLQIMAVMVLVVLIMVRVAQLKPLS